MQSPKPKKVTEELKRKVSWIVLFLLLIPFVLTGCQSASDEESEIEYAETTLQLADEYKKYAGIELSVYNWGYYISDGSDGSIDVNAEFEKLTGIKILYDNYDSNESLYAKLDGGGADYDVIIPSDYMIGRLITEGYLAELNFDLIPNYKYVADEYKGTGIASYDPECKYSVPYNVGMVGVIYNTTMVDGTPDSWSLLWDEKYANKLLNFNNPRDAFAIAQFYQGVDINSENKDDWDKAFDKLVEQKPLLQSYVMDEVFNKMESGEAAAAPYYAGDFFTMYENNEDLAFYYPKEGTNRFIDAACVLKTSKHQEAAALYINFLMDPEIARANAEYMYYASPNTAVIENEEYLEFLESLHPNAYDILYGSVSDVPSDAFENISVETKSYMSEKWTKLGATITEDSGNESVYVLFAVIVVLLLALFGINTFKKIKRERESNL